METHKTTFHFKSLVASEGFKLESTNKRNNDLFTAEFLEIFSNKDEEDKATGTISNPLSYDVNIKNKVFDFIDRNSSKFPSLNGLTSFFNKLEEGNLYVIIFNIELTAELSLYLSSHLKAWENDEDVNKLVKEDMDLFGTTFENYRTRIAGDFRKAVGNPIRKQRVCRFCNESMPKVTFKKKAHAISEALGNKNIVLYDECDKCNERFGKTIEGDIITYLELFRTIYGIKGKGGKKKIKGKNFEASKGEGNQIEIKFFSLDDRPKVGDDYNIKLEFDKKVTHQNIYKTLTKFFISVIDDSELPNFEDSINWINGKINAKELPLVGEAINYDTFVHHPRLLYFLRKSDDTNLPYAVCQFFYTCKMFLFVVPFSSKDSVELNRKIDWKHTFKSLSHLDKYKGWGFYNHSNNTPRTFTISLNTDIKTEE
ncbi:HNH endonuclease [Psychroserpens sp.]